MLVSHRLRLAGVALLASVTIVVGAAPAATAQPAQAPPGTWQSVGSLPAAGDSDFTDVLAFSDRDVWAVGAQDYKDWAGRPLVMHFDGVKWTEFPVPGDKEDHVWKLSALGPKNIWGVQIGWEDGSDGDFGVIRFDGVKWSRVKTAPVKGDMVPVDVDAIAPDDVWLLGNNDAELGAGKPFLQHFDGRTWKNVPAPADGFYSDLVRTPSGGLVLGGEVVRAGRSTPAVARWDGKAWQEFLFPELGDGRIRDMTLVGDHVIATGYGDSGSTDLAKGKKVGFPRLTPRMGSGQRLGTAADSRSFVVRGAGTTWAAEKLPFAHGRAEAITPDGRGGVWVSGSYGASWDRPLLAHYDGRTWSEGKAEPGLARTAAALRGLARVPGSTRIWAVGGIGYPDKPGTRNLVARFGY